MLNFACLRFQLALSGSIDRYALFGIKNCFYDAFEDSSTRLGDHDAMRTVFGQELTTDASALRRFQKPPLPFAFHIPLVPVNRTGQIRATLSLAVAGSAFNHLPVFILAVKSALQSLTAKDSFHVEITSCTSVANDGHCSEVTSKGEGLSILTTPEAPCVDMDVRIEVSTPLRLIQNGIMLRRLSFSDFIRPLMRRVSAIAYYYGSVELDLDFRCLSAASSLVQSADIQFSVDKYPFIGEGLIGSVMFKGVTADYYPFLAMGEHFNLGKGASYGGGEYRLAELDS